MYWENRSSLFSFRRWPTPWKWPEWKNRLHLKIPFEYLKTNVTFDIFMYIIMDIIRQEALEIYQYFLHVFFRILDLEENQALLILITTFILISRLKNQEEVRAKKEAKILAMAMEQKARAQVIRRLSLLSMLLLLLFWCCYVVCCCCFFLLLLWFTSVVASGHIVFLQLKILRL